MDPSLILCAVDFSASSRGAASEAARLAQALARPLLLLHVQHPPKLSFAITLPTVGNVLASTGEAEARQLEALRDELAARCAGARVEVAVVDGVPWRQIVEVARQRHAGLIVIGAHGQSELRDVLLGSVAERVLQHAPCSVLVVRPDATPVPR